MTHRRLRLERSRRHDLQVRMGLQRRRHLRERAPRPVRRSVTPTPPRGTNPGRPAGHRDNGGKTSTTTRPVTVGSRANRATTRPPCSPPLARPLLAGLGETTGPTFSDSKGSSPATASGGRHRAVGANPARSPKTPTTPPGSTAGETGAAQATVNLPAATHTLTVEFWLNWETSSTATTSWRWSSPTTSTKTPAASSSTRTPLNSAKIFGVAVGSGNSRNNIFFERPSAGAWHYYAFVDGLNGQTRRRTDRPLRRRQSRLLPEARAAAPGPATFANSILNFMSRGAASNFGAGNLDEVGIYERALSADDDRQTLQRQRPRGPSRPRRERQPGRSPKPARA